MRRRLEVASCLLLASVILVAPRLVSQWSQQQTNVVTAFSAVTFFDNFNGYTSGAFGAILKTTDGGTTWVTQNSGTNLHFSDQCFVNLSTGWLVGQSGVIAKTTNGGTTWVLQNSGTTEWLNCVCFRDANNGWTAGTNGAVLWTSNGGTTWNQQTTGRTATIEGGSFTSATAGFLACDDGCVLKTTNGGSVWSAQPLNTSQHLYAVTFVTSLVGWVTGSSGTIMKTTDGGATWTNQQSGTTQSLNMASFVDVNNGWAVGDGGTIVYTTNGGATWTSQPSGTTQNLRAVNFVSAQRGFAVGMTSTILSYVNSALPIQLSRFTAFAAGANSVRLNWTTISEIRNYGFEIQRGMSSSGPFATLEGSFVAGHGTTNQPQQYTWNDNDAIAGRLYYRLRQVDLDGSVNYSDPVSVDVLAGVSETSRPLVFGLKQNYPNPFNPSTQIRFSIAKAGRVTLQVFDVVGRLVATILNEEMNQGTYTKSFSSEGLSSGVYFYKLQAGSLSDTKKFIVAK